MTRERLLRLVVLAVVIIGAGLVRFVFLDTPERIVFDETYYVDDARAYLERGVETGFAVHPPIGKWLIALGVALVGDNPAGWRVASAAAGTAIVLVTYLAGRRLFGTAVAGVLAGLLVAVDGLLLVQSRIAMLDVFLALFVVVGAWLLLVDLDRLRSADPIPRLRERTALLLAGASFGLAVATKWSGVFALVAAGIVVLIAEVQRRRHGRAERRRVGAMVAAAGLALVVVPVAVYGLSHLPWLVSYPDTHEAQRSDCLVGDEVIDPCPVAAVDRVRGLARHHVSVWRYHRDLEADHPYESHAWTWPLMIRPIVYYWESCPEGRTGDSDEPCVVEAGNAAEIIALGNPALWWTALLALIPLMVGLIRRDARAGFITAFWAVQYAPWVVVDRPLFFFYMTPIVPFMALGVAYAAVWLGELRRGSAERRPPWRDPGVIVSVVVAFAAVVLLAYFFPVLTGMESDIDSVRHRWWFRTWI